jgi:hypothetical protein
VADTEDDKETRQGDSEKPSTRPAGVESEAPAGEEAAEAPAPKAGFESLIDEDVTAAPETARPAPVAPRRGGGLLPALLGGVLAAGVGFATAQYIQPEGWSFPGAEMSDESQVALDATRAALDEIKADIDALAAADKAAQALAPRISDVASQVAALEDRISALGDAASALADKVASFDQRLTDVLKAPVEAAGGATAKALAAYEQEISAMREENAQLSESVNNLAKESEAEVGAAMDRAAQVEARAAMMRVDAALASGAPFASALDQFGDVEVPEGLTAVAADGVATLADLQRDFPAAARAALEAAREDQAQGDVTDRVGAFLRTQLGIRSLAPHEGSDPDAVLSRAEAALRDGEVRHALSELDELPDPARAAMSGWIEDATARADALDAAQTLEQSLNSN